MTESKIIDDLNYVKSIAEEGESAPLVGNRIGLMWGILLTITFLSHWAIISGRAGIHHKNLMFVWLGLAVFGSLFTFILSKSLKTKPGRSSVGNRAKTAVWVSFNVMLIASFFGMLLQQVLNNGTYIAYDAIVGISFAGQIMAYTIISSLSQEKALLLPAAFAFITTIFCFAYYGTPTLYLIAAIGIFFTVIIPSTLLIRKEPASVI